MLNPWANGTQKGDARNVKTERLSTPLNYPTSIFAGSVVCNESEPRGALRYRVGQKVPSYSNY